MSACRCSVTRMRDPLGLAPGSVTNVAVYVQALGTRLAILPTTEMMAGRVGMATCLMHVCEDGGLRHVRMQLWRLKF